MTRKPRPMDSETPGQLQRAAVFERARGICEFETAVIGLIPGETHYRGYRIVEWVGEVAWLRCGWPASHTAHIWRRWKCGDLPTDDGPALKHHELVALAGCYQCHTRFDSRRHTDKVRPPADRVMLSKVLIEHTLAAARARGLAAAPVDLTEFDRPLGEEQDSSVLGVEREL